MKNLKYASYGKFSNYHKVWVSSWVLKEKFQITNPKFGSLVFRVSRETEYQHQPLWNNHKMAPILYICIVWQIFKLLMPPTSPSPNFGSLVFQCWWKQNMGVHHYEKIEDMHCRVKFQITKLFSLPQESPMCSFTLPDIFWYHCTIWSQNCQILVCRGSHSRSWRIGDYFKK